MRPVPHACFRHLGEQGRALRQEKHFLSGLHTSPQLWQRRFEQPALHHAWCSATASPSSPAFAVRASRRAPAWGTRLLAKRPAAACVPSQLLGGSPPGWLTGRQLLLASGC